MDIARWLPVLAIGIRMFFFGGVMKANGVTLNYTVEKLNTTHASVAWAFTLQCAVAFLVTPLGGTLLRYLSCRQLGVIGGFFAGLGYVCAGISVKFVWQLCVYHTISGLGFGLMCLPSVLYLHANYPKSFNAIMAVSTSFIYIGISVLPLTQQWMIDHYGYDGGTMCFGALVWNCILCGVLLRPTVNSDNIAKSMDTESAVKREQLHICDKYGFLLSAMLRHRNFAIMMVFSMIAMYVYSSWAIFLVSFGEAQGLPTGEAVLLSTLGGIGGLFGSLLTGCLIYLNFMNPYTCFLLPSLVNGSALILSVYYRSFGALSLLMLVSGIAQGLEYGAICGITPSLVCPFHLESGLATSFFIEGIWYQIGGAVSGMIQDVCGYPQAVFLVSGLASLLVTPLTFVWTCDKTPIQLCYDNL